MWFLGFDPGGQNSFGWAVLLVGSSGHPEDLKTGVCSDAIAALDRANRFVGTAPTAIGIDAPLYWSAAGDRKADARIRKLVCTAGGKSGTVGHVNSLRGACLVQGALIAYHASELWPSATITEAHPKALLRVSYGAQGFHKSQLHSVPTEHERDAGLAAYSAWAAATRLPGWRNLVAEEVAPFFPSGRQITYWFPVE